MPDYDSIVERLTAIEAELRDLAFDELTSVVRDPDSDEALAARREEKRLLQARRAVAKAIGALGGAPDLGA